MALRSVVLRAYGRTVALSGPPAVLAELQSQLPPSYREWPGRSPERTWSVVAGPAATWKPVVDGEDMCGWTTLPGATNTVLCDLELWVAEWARSRVFVHAGCVVVGGRAIVLPGPTIAGKSTLTTALVQAGAQYYSDEYAVLDHTGVVRPYARPLVHRSLDGSPRRAVPVEELGGTAGRGPAPVALVAALRHHFVLGWHVQNLTRGQAVLRLLENAVAARSRPRAVLAAVERATEGAAAVAGTRGEAGEAAERLMAMLGSA